MNTAERGMLPLLPPATKERLFSLGTTDTVPKGTVLFDELTQMEELLFLLDGYVSLYRSSFQGESRIIFICSKGEVLNEVCIENEKTSIAARTLTDVTLLRINRSHADVLMQQDPLFSQALFRSLAQKTRRLYHKVGNATGTYTLRSRMAAAIWKLARDCGCDTPQGRTVCFEVTVNFLSTLMGAKRETASRVLSEMKRSGLLLHENGVLTVPDLNALRSSFAASD